VSVKVARLELSTNAFIGVVKMEVAIAATIPPITMVITISIRVKPD
jgi:hypothetical protein